MAQLVKKFVCNARGLGSFDPWVEAWVRLIPGLGRSPGEGKGYPFQCSGLENSRDYSSWGHKVSDTTERLSPYLYYFSPFAFVFFKLLRVMSLVLKLLQMEFQGPKPGRSFGNTVVLEGF